MLKKTVPVVVTKKVPRWPSASGKIVAAPRPSSPHGAPPVVVEWPIPVLEASCEIR